MAITMNERRAKSPEFIQPPAVPDPFFWLDASDLSTMGLNAGRAFQWRDKSESNFHGVQANTSKQPFYALKVQNGKNGLLFNRGRRDVLTASINTINQPFTLYIVAREFGGSGSRFAIAATSSIWRVYMSTNRIRMDNGGVPLPTGATVIGTTTRLHTLIFNGGSSQLFLERDINPLSGNVLSSPVLSGLDIGDDASSGSSRAWNGYIFEIRGYTGVHGIVERTATWDQMIPKWGL